jgi:inorganic pyrophosphatase
VKPETFIGKQVHIEIDRPLGSVHPEHGNIWFCCNYGYVPGVSGGDGEELDAYLLGVFTPVTAYDGICVAVIKRGDGDDKLVVVPEGIDYTDEQILALTEFIERFHNSYLVRQ